MHPHAKLSLDDSLFVQSVNYCAGMGEVKIKL
jgi:hypothetical protein